MPPNLSAPSAVLTALAVIVALKLGQTLLAPLILALVVGIVLAPMTSKGTELGAPPPLMATLALLLAALATFSLVVFLEPHVSTAVSKAPVLWEEIRQSVEGARAMIGEVERVTDTVTEALTDAPANDAAADDDGIAELPDARTAIAWAPSVAAQLLTFSGALFFFVLGRDQTYAQLARQFKSVTVERLEIAEKLVSRYFLTITAINAVLGTAVAIAMAAIGLGAPVLWGGLAFLLNFIIYLGPIALATALLIAGIVTFDGAAVLLPPAIYLMLNMTEAQFVTPQLVGRRLQINPLVVFVSLVGWLWLWGPVGGVIAIPVLVWVLAITGSIDLETNEPATPQPETSS